MTDIITKSQYAVLKGVTAAAVSQWIKAGRIGGAALVGTGRAAKIDVAEAERQWTVSMDMGQQLAQQTVRAPRPTASAELPLVYAPAAADDPQSRYQRARAEQAEIDTAKARRKDLAERGLYMVTADARDVWSKELAELVQAIDAWLPDLSEKLIAAGVGGADHKSLTLALRAEWRGFRQKQSAKMASVHDSEPDLVAEPDVGDDDAA